MNNIPKARDSRDVPSMQKRSLHHDYHGRGIYLITLCTEGRQPLLGKLTGGAFGRKHGPGKYRNNKIILNNT